MKTLHIYSDGGSRGNPGPAATGYVIKDAKSGEILVQSGKYLGKTTNNVAEYNAVLQALTKAMELKPDEIICHLDSELIVRQLNGIYKIKATELKKIAEQVKELIFFKPVKFVHILRHKNAHADAIVNKILDKYATA